VYDGLVHDRLHVNDGLRCDGNGSVHNVVWVDDLVVRQALYEVVRLILVV
jgi:hypothetical protein